MTRGYLALLAFVALLGVFTSLLLRGTGSQGVPPEGPLGDVRRDTNEVLDGASVDGPIELVQAGDQPDTQRSESSEADSAAEQPVRVRVTDAANGALVQRFWVRPAGLQDMASEVKRVVSEPGMGEVELGGDAWHDPLSPRFLLVSAPMYQPEEVPADGPFIKVSLRRASGIVGIVRDGDSAPLPFADVRLEALDPETIASPKPIPFPDSFKGATLRKTDAAGAFAFASVPAGLYRTTVRRDGTSQISPPITVQPGEWAHSDHWLDERARLTVTLMTSAGDPAKASRVSVCEVPPNGGPPDDTSVIASRYTDDDGRATLGPLPAGSYRVIVLSDEGTAEPATLTVSEDSHPLEELTIQLNEK